MAFDEYLAERISRVLDERKVIYFQKKMMGGLVFMVDNKMCLGIARDKNSGEDRLMVRIGEEAIQSNSHKDGIRPMEFTGRPMKDYSFIYPEGYDMEEDLEFWVDLALTFNPQAKKSIKRSKKK
ncbi:TfoX/Sxy family protein [Algoriphagus sediminis]|uniref:TfoX/Sxy family protein n=1 Tax=Algoriphagus sediminis TaxID=3057113 RepID=A0ABT7YBG8_9BACT|nr:TfoX/Sxy family protein [Algoriphagus sediminis]MDN3203871.1 TfoX/Sxy family protein [Algoriphagus sediminis]